MAVAFAHYARFLDRTGSYIAGRSYQNFFVGETRTFDSVQYLFGPYGIAGLSSSRNGDSGQASLIATANEITVPLFSEAILNRWLLEVKTVSIIVAEATAFTESTVIASEVWACTGGSNDLERPTITLSSPLNAARQEIPGRILTRSMVGAIPPTGQIVIS
jgi:hypothetical protein